MNIQNFPTFEAVFASAGVSACGVLLQILFALLAIILIMTFAGLSGMGDLIVTCTSMHSRNRRCGILIGQGKKVREAMDQVGATVEGYFAALSAHQLSEKIGVEMPICQCAYGVLYEDRPVGTVVEQLMTRSKRHEEDRSWL